MSLPRLNLPVHILAAKVTGPEITYLRTETEFGKAKLLEIFFSKFSLKEKWNWHLTQVVSCVLDLRAISYEILKLNWHRAPKLSTPKMYTVYTSVTWLHY